MDFRSTRLVVLGVWTILAVALTATVTCRLANWRNRSSFVQGLETARAAAAVAGFHPPDTAQPTTHLPAPSQAVANISGSRPWIQRNPSPSSINTPGKAPGCPEVSTSTTGLTPGLPEPTIAPWPAPGDLACEAGCDLVQIGDEILARVLCGAKLQGPDGHLLVELPLAPAQESTFQLDRRRLRSHWRLQAFTGVSAGGPMGLEAGGLWTGRRWGFYGMAEYVAEDRFEPARWRYHAGVVINLH